MGDILSNLSHRSKIMILYEDVFATMRIRSIEQFVRIEYMLKSNEAKCALNETFKFYMHREYMKMKHGPDNAKSCIKVILLNLLREYFKIDVIRVMEDYVNFNKTVICEFFRIMLRSLEEVVRINRQSVDTIEILQECIRTLNNHYNYQPETYEKKFLELSINR